MLRNAVRGYRRDGFLQQLEALAPELNSRIKRDAGKVAAGPGKARDQPSLQRIDHERNNRDGAGEGLECEHDRVGSGDDQIRIAIDDLPRDVRIALVMPLGGIAFYQKILSFDVTEPAQFAEEGAPCAATASFSKGGNRTCLIENRYPALRRSVLRRSIKGA